MLLHTYAIQGCQCVGSIYDTGSSVCCQCTIQYTVCIGSVLFNMWYIVMSQAFIMINSLVSSSIFSVDDCSTDANNKQWRNCNCRSTCIKPHGKLYYKQHGHMDVYA